MSSGVTASSAVARSIGPYIQGRPQRELGRAVALRGTAASDRAGPQLASGWGVWWLCDHNPPTVRLRRPYPASVPGPLSGRLEVKAAVVPDGGASRWAEATRRRPGRAASRRAERTKIQVRAAPTAVSPTRTQLEPASATAKEWSSRRPWSTAPLPPAPGLPRAPGSSPGRRRRSRSSHGGIATIAAVDIGA